jgi:hypothetical protein
MIQNLYRKRKSPPLLKSNVNSKKIKLILERNLNSTLITTLKKWQEMTDIYRNWKCASITKSFSTIRKPTE